MSAGRSWTLVSSTPAVRRTPPRHGKRLRRDSPALVLWAILALVVSVKGIETDGAGVSGAAIAGRYEEKVCSNIDIRNSVGAFRKLDNCTVVEGFLQVQLIDHAEPGEYANLSFPRLREITGYLLLFRVKNLKSLRTIFPNLAVIRGSDLFHNYALVVYEMFEMEEIGLRSLTDILRGGVRIEMNPRLCYVHSVDWDLIAPDSKGAHFFKENNKRNECPNTCPGDCPALAGKGPLCWSQEDCQKKCETSCGSGTCTKDGGECCHPSCVGGCWDATMAGCHVCRHFRSEQGCGESCPNGTFLYLGRRCLDADECRSLKYSNGELTVNARYKPFNGRCERECPSGYTTDPEHDSSCVPCEKECPKECPESSVTNIADAQNLKSCTIIQGDLEIKISGALVSEDVQSELRANLNTIAEIRGQLRVIGSFPITSFDFLSGLRKIEGRKDSKLHADRYTLYVVDNPNLKELWDWNAGEANLTLGSGKLFFDLNPKLCIEKIRELERRTGLNVSDSRDVSLASNGDHTACKVKTLSLLVTRTNHSAVDFQFTNFLHKKERQIDASSLLGYLIGYKEASSGNVSLFDDANVCTSKLETWKLKVVNADVDKNVSMISCSITNLKPFTRYAIYVKTYMMASKESGGGSDIHYFTTASTTPTPPVNLKASSETHNVVRVSWEPPKSPNGLVSFYVVVGELVERNENFIYSVEYCRLGLKLSELPKEALESAATELPPASNDTDGEACCDCPKDKVQVAQEQQEHQDRIDFEDFLHNNIFRERNNVNYARTAPKRSRRELSEGANGDAVSSSVREDLGGDGSTALGGHPENSTDTTTGRSAGRNRSFFRVTNDTFVRFAEARHFTSYIVKVRACHGERRYRFEVEASALDLAGDADCSQESITAVRTAAAPLVDIVNATTINATVSTESRGSVFVKWDAPADPNGLVLKFDVETRLVDGDHTPKLTCVSYETFANASGVNLTSLSAGNYSLRVSATTLWRSGEWSEAAYFCIREPPSSVTPAVVGGVATAVVVFLAAIVAGAVVYVKKRELRLPNRLITSVNPEYLSAEDVYKVDEWEVPREKITLLRELGQGSFGMVYEGEAKDVVEGKPVVRCAVKTVNSSALLRDRIEFLNEASVMKGLSCHHVVQLLGVVSKGQPTYVVMELMFHGDLKTYLRLHRPDEYPLKSPPSTKRILQMAIEIADGMAYLADEKFVHRDLAARNCMVAEDLTVKIGDFGMARGTNKSDYYRRGSKKADLPVRWMAPESMKDGVFSSQSDVWSFGVVLWEMATLASQPYQGLSNDQVIKYVLDGETMERPENCPEILHEMMVDCWNYNPKSRPTFAQLVELLLPSASARFTEVSFYHRFRTRPSPEPEDEEYVLPSTPPCCQHRDGGDDYTTLAIGQEVGQKRSRSRPDRQYRVVRPDPLRADEEKREGYAGDANGRPHARVPREV